MPKIELLPLKNRRKEFFSPGEFLVLLEELPNYLKPLAEVAYHTGWQQRRSFR